MRFILVAHLWAWAILVWVYSPIFQCSTLPWDLLSSETAFSNRVFLPFWETCTRRNPINKTKMPDIIFSIWELISVHLHVISLLLSCVINSAGARHLLLPV